MKFSNKLAAGLGVLCSIPGTATFTAADEAAAKKPQAGATAQSNTRLAQITAGTPSTPRTPRTPTRPATAPTTVSQLIAALNRAEGEMNGDALIFAYGQSVTNPLLARGALAHLMFDYYGLRSKATSAMQASQAVDEAILRFSVMQAAQNQVTVQQNQIIIDQNQRIIALLEQIAKK
ncbi:MAG TPA: hypothetical protein VNA16_07945 [Abditibacteriaceae bacterium]|nr:hypothetical protein [Abditibacteriaceae bacterium]